MHVHIYIYIYICIHVYSIADCLHGPPLRARPEGLSTALLDGVAVVQQVADRGDEVL